MYFQFQYKNILSTTKNGHFINKTIFLLVLFSLFATNTFCRKTDSIPTLKVRNEAILPILDSLFQKQWKKIIFEREVCSLTFEKKEDTVYVKISYMLKRMPKSEQDFLRNSLYGCFYFANMPIFVFGEDAENIFDKTDESGIIDFLTSEKVIDDKNFIPIIFDPDIYVYYIYDNTIYFKCHDFL